MKKYMHILLLLVLTAVLLSACGKPETATTIPEVTSPTQAPELLPTQAEQTAPSAPVEPPTAATAEPVVATISGQTLLEERCGSCHSIEKVTGETGTYEEWEKIVNDMIRRGAKLTDEERAVLVQFLADNYK